MRHARRDAPVPFAAPGPCAPIPLLRVRRLDCPDAARVHARGRAVEGARVRVPGVALSVLRGDHRSDRAVLPVGDLGPRTLATFTRLANVGHYLLRYGHQLLRTGTGSGGWWPR
jgi:hypothetical protein